MGLHWSAGNPLDEPPCQPPEWQATPRVPRGVLHRCRHRRAISQESRLMLEWRLAVFHLADTTSARIFLDRCHPLLRHAAFTSCCPAGLEATFRDENHTEFMARGEGQ